MKPNLRQSRPADPSVMIRVGRGAALSVFAWVLLLACERAEIVSLNGTWDYRAGFEESWLTDSSGPWKTVNLPEHFNRLPEFKDGQGLITLRHRLPDALAARMKTGTPLAFSSGQVSDTARCYFNSALAGALGSDDPYLSGHNLQLVQTLPIRAYRDSGPNELFVIVRSIGKYRFWMKGPVIEIGPAEEIFLNLNRRTVIAMFIISAYLMIGFYHLLLLARRRQDTYNLYFGIFSTAIAVWIFMSSDIAHLMSADTVLLRRRIDQISLMFAGPSFLLFLESYFGQKHSRIGLGWAALCAVVACIDVFAPFKVMLMGLQVWMASMALGGSLIVFRIVREAFCGNRDASLLAAGVILLIGGSGFDILIDRGLVRGSFVTQYTLILFDAGIAVVLANRYARVQREIVVLNESLESKVQVRTGELQESLRQVQQLKNQQDGDYFLTSQLIAPLSRIDFNDAELHIATIIKQKKSFQYKKWSADLGGDLVTSHEIELRGIRYTVIVNADAMGKSMQGAGGALVLGSAVKSIITRTNAAPELAKDSPEQWLRRCYLDLQSLFVSFDGTMIVSTILVLVNKASGLMLWVNAEHPRPVLYRGSKAAFFKKEAVMRKLGVDDNRVKFVINAAQLLQGDVVYLGSDGRDDIRILRSDGSAEMNEDEMLFLDTVEKADGRLDQLIDSLERSGEITDDLSLIRIAYKEDQPLRKPDAAGDASFQALLNEGKSLLSRGDLDAARALLEKALMLNPDDATLLETLLNLSRKRRDFVAAADFAVQYAYSHPANNSILHIASLMYGRLGRFDDAIDYAERCRLREPDQVKNLVHLADLHRAVGNIDRTSALLFQAQQIDPKSPYVVALAGKLRANSTAPDR